MSNKAYFFFALGRNYKTHSRILQLMAFCKSIYRSPQPNRPKFGWFLKQKLSLSSFRKKKGIKIASSILANLKLNLGILS